MMVILMSILSTWEIYVLKLFFQFNILKSNITDSPASESDITEVLNILHKLFTFQIDVGKPPKTKN